MSTPFVASPGDPAPVGTFTPTAPPPASPPGPVAPPPASSPLVVPPTLPIQSTPYYQPNVLPLNNGAMNVDTPVDAVTQALMRRYQRRYWE